MIWKVKKSNFIVYFWSFAIGMFLIIISIILYYLKCPELVNNIFLSIGCSTIPTVMVAYLIDRANEIREAEKIRKLRDSFLWGMPYGLLWISKVVIEEYYPFDDTKGQPFINVFNKAISIMETIKVVENDNAAYENQRDNLMKKLDYGISLCFGHCKSILDHEYELQINSIFSKDELINIRYLFEECERIKNSYLIAETAEYIKVFVEVIYNGIKEVKIKLDRNIIIENHRIRNWIELSK